MTDRAISNLTAVILAISGVLAALLVPVLPILAPVSAFLFLSALALFMPEPGKEKDPLEDDELW